MVFKITQAEHLRAITRPGQAPPARPAAIFAGRSNVGKSSLINRLVGRRALARTSQTPGRTQEIHFYGINGRYYFIDLPGYGYARVPVEVRRRWGPMIEGFLKKAEGVALVVVILDVRREPTPEDLQLVQWLDAAGHPYVFAVTKCDKVGRAECGRRLEIIQGVLGLTDDSALVPVSARSGAGIADLLRVIGDAFQPQISHTSQIDG